MHLRRIHPPRAQAPSQAASSKVARAKARARDTKGWHHVDASGKPAYARRFTAVEPFYNGQARVERSAARRVIITERRPEVLGR
jgi:hypothetical protein